VGHVSRSSGLLCLEASRGRVFQSSLKTGGGMMRLVHVASTWRSCGNEAEDRWVDTTSYIGLLYPNFVVSIVLGPKGIFIFWLDI
jgi:hypothetical protein